MDLQKIYYTIGQQMRAIPVKRAFLLIFTLATYTYYVWLRLQNSIYIREPRMSFGDTTDYLRLASMPLFSSSFWISWRPPITPLFFKILRSDPDKIFTTQLWLSILAWGILALVVMLAVSTYLLKPIAFIVILGFSLSQNIIMWDSLILSDSLAISLLALFLASCIWLVAEWKFYKYFILIVITTLLVFVRDTYAYLVLMAGLALLPCLFFSMLRKPVLLVSGLFISLFILNGIEASAGRRWEVPFLYTMSLRILPNPEYLSYFENRGMPVTDALKERSGYALFLGETGYYEDPRLEDFRSWLENRGRQEYIRFLWHYKADTLQKPFDDIVKIFNPDVYYYAATGFHPIITNERLAEILYPVRFGILMTLLSNLLAALLIFPAIQNRQIMWVIPIMLVLFSYPQAVLIWNADANDIARHALYHTIELRGGGMAHDVFCL